MFKITKLINSLFKTKVVYEVGQVWECPCNYIITITKVNRGYIYYQDTERLIGGWLTKEQANTWLKTLIST